MQEQQFNLTEAQRAYALMLLKLLLNNMEAGMMVSSTSFQFNLLGHVWVNVPDGEIHMKLGTTLEFEEDGEFSFLLEGEEYEQLLDEAKENS